MLVAAKGLGEVQRLLSSETGEIEVVLGEREVVFRVGTTEVTTRLIEGEFPNYQQLIPSGYPNRLTVSREALQAAVNRVRLVGQSKDTAPIRLGMSAEGPRALGDRAGRRRGARVGRGEVRGHRPHRRVQLAVPPRRHRRGRVRRGRDRVDRSAEAGGDEGHRLRRLPLPADAGAHRLTAARRAPGRALADRLPLLRGGDAPVPARGHGDLRRQRAGQDQPARGGRVGRDRASRSGGCPTRALVRAGRDAAILRAEVVDDERVQLLEAEIRARGPQPGAAQQQPRAADPRPPRPHAGDGVRARRPAAGEGRSRRPARLPRRPPGRALAPVRGGADRLRAGAQAAQRAAAGRAAGRGRGRHPRRLRPAAGGGGRRAGPRPAEAARAAGARGGGRLRGARRRPHPDHARPTRPSGSAIASTGSTAISTRRCSTRSRPTARPRSTAASRWSGRIATSGACSIGGLESRTHASQGEQRTLALALRLGGHRLCGELTGSAPVLLLDDVFSELDDQRAVALVAHLDAGQTLVTTAGTVPRGIAADRMLRVDAGHDRARRRSDDGALTRSDEPVPLSDALATIGAEFGLAPGDAHGHARRRAGPRSWGPTSPRTRDLVSVRDGRAHGGGRRPDLGDPVALPRDRRDRAARPALAGPGRGRPRCGCAWARPDASPEAPRNRPESTPNPGSRLVH